MPMRQILFATAVAAVSLSAPAFAGDTALNYPETDRGAVVETLFGEQVADPYRWLEADVRVDSKVAAWVDDQSRFADSYLKALPERAGFEKKLEASKNSGF